MLKTKKILIKYSKLIPLILYPYAYWLWVICEQGLFLVIATLIYNIYVLFISIYHPISVVRKNVSTQDAARMNLLIKGLQIPAYLFHFLLGIAGIMLGPIFGFPLIVLAVVVDWLTILLSGISSIGCNIQMKREGLISTGKAFWMLIGSFVYCVDVFIAIKYVRISKKAL